MNLNFNAAENELLLTQTAATQEMSEREINVILVPAHVKLCVCQEATSANLIKKLFNKGLEIPNP